MFENFPKRRPALPLEYETIYAEQYKQNRDGSSTASGLAQKMEAWMHRRAAADQGKEKKTLEIGAGTLNHLMYEPRTEHYDIVEPFEYLYKSSPHRHRISSVYSDVSEIEPKMKYHRILSIAAFEHICDLPSVVARCGMLLADGGSVRVGIPSEGTFLWKLGYRMTTGLEFKLKYGLDYEVLMRHEHVNDAAEINEVLGYFFSDVKRSAFGLIPSLSLYQFFACSNPNLDRCSRYLT